MYRYKVIVLALMLLFWGCCLASLSKALTGTFKLIGKTAHDYERFPFHSGPRAIKLVNGDVLLYSFSAFEKGPNGLVGAVGEDAEYHKLFEIYRVKDGKFEVTAPSHYFHFGGGALLLKSGKVLFVGGCPYAAIKYKHKLPKTAQVCKESLHIEIYDPSTQKSSIGASLSMPINSFGKTLLKDGRVFFATDTPEIYDPEADRFTPAGKSSSKKLERAIPLTLNNGNVFIFEDDGLIEIFEPENNTFRSIQRTNLRRRYPTILKLLDGRVFILGGSDEKNHELTSAEIFDPRTETFKFVGNMTIYRGPDFNAVLLKNGNVLITGGGIYDDEHWLSVHFETFRSAEIFDPQTERFYAIGKMRRARNAHESILLDNGNVLIIGGKDYYFVRNAELYIPD